MVDWINEYTAIPFKDGGRDRWGCDCWGLVRLVLRERFGKKLPDLSGEYETAHDRAQVFRLVDAQKPLLSAQRLAGPQTGAVVVMMRRGLPVHVGVMLDELHVLHVEQGKNSVVERIDNTRLKSRIEGFYSVG